MWCGRCDCRGRGGGLRRDSSTLVARTRRASTPPSAPQQEPGHAAPGSRAIAGPLAPAGLLGPAARPARPGLHEGCRAAAACIISCAEMNPEPSASNRLNACRSFSCWSCDSISTENSASLEEPAPLLWTLRKAGFFRKLTVRSTFGRAMSCGARRHSGLCWAAMGLAREERAGSEATHECVPAHLLAHAAEHHEAFP